MTAPAIAIRLLSARIRAADAERAFAARGLLDQARQRIGPHLDAALAGAGLDPEAVIVLPRLSLRLHVQGEVEAGALATAWGEALAQAILAALPEAPMAAAGAAEQHGEHVAQFRDIWAAEAAILDAVCAGLPLPWWAAEILPGASMPEDAVAPLLAGWVARDAIRAAWRMTALVARQPRVAGMLTAAQATALAASLLAAGRLARAVLLQPAASAPPPSRPAGEATSLATAEARRVLQARLPPAWHAALAGLAPALRQPWLAAALLASAPAEATPAMLAALAALPPDASRLPSAPGTAAAPGRPLAAAPMPACEVWCGGLLLLIRPLARLRPDWLARGEALPARLLAVGLVAAQRLAAPLPPAARRAALERDRALLALFAGLTPPEGPLDAAELPAGAAVEAGEALASLLAAAPPGMQHAPGALRRAYGRDPFAADAEADALCRLLLRPGRLLRAEGIATLTWPLDSADAALRRAGWDQDPGWVPWLGQRILFRYGAT